MTTNLHVIPAGLLRTNAYLLTDPARGEAVLIDAPGDVWSAVEPVLVKEKCRLVELWITHGHWDHMEGGAEVVRATGAKVRAHADDKVLLETPEVMSAVLLQLLGEVPKLEPVPADVWVSQGERFNALGLEVEVRHVPGHCPGNVLFYFAAAKVAFVGDTLFAGGMGRTDLPGGDPALLPQMIRERIYTLPEETTVFPGHGPRTTVGEEKRTNPYVRG